MAYSSKADVLGYGGQAGGGKSDLILGTAITHHKRAIIFRREAKQGRSLIDRSREILTGIGRFNEVAGVWRGLPGGAQLEFAGVKDPHDVMNWRGQPHDFIGIDEADSFLESQVRFLLGWLRTTIPGQPCQAILCFNPPATAEGRWLIDYFGPWLDRKHPNPATQGELRWYATLIDQNGQWKEVERPDGKPFTHKGDTVYPRSRTFIPASVRDNPDLMATDYLSQLLALPEPLRSQLAYGDFDAGMEDDEWQVIPTAWVEAAMKRWKPDGYLTFRLSALGVDVARGGPAKTVLARRHAHWFAKLLKYPGKGTPNGPIVAALIGKALGEVTDALINIDVLGPGSSVVDHAKGLGQVKAINFGARGGIEKATDKSGKLFFANIRAYAYWRMREVLDPANAHNIQLPPDRELLADLTAPKYKNVGGRIQVEPKEDIVKRLDRSPDCADAVVLAILTPR